MAAPEMVKNPWEEHQDEDGTPFYYNSVTKESVWDKPPDFHVADINNFVLELQKVMKQSAKVAEKQSAGAAKKQTAKVAEKQSAGTTKKQSAEAAKKQSARASKKQSAEAAKMQSAKTAEKQPAKAKEELPATSMEVEESEESDFEPVVKSRRTMTTKPGGVAQQ